MSGTDAAAMIAAVNKHFTDCVNRGDVAAACTVYTETARLMPPGSPMVRGRQAIEGFWRAALPALGVKSAKLSTVELEIVGDRAIEVGEATLALESGPAKLKYIVVWKRGSDGAWRWDADIWNDGGVA